MVKDYKFRDIEKYLRKDSTVGEEILNAFESLSDVAIIFSPIILGPQLLPMLELLDVKDRLCTLTHKIYDYIAKKSEMTYLDRMEQIKTAYALICYTAYFDVLQDAFPKEIRKKLKLMFEKKKELLEKSVEITEPLQGPPVAFDIQCAVYCADHITSFSEIKEQLVEIYARVSRNLIKAIEKEPVFDENSKEDKKKYEQLKVKLEKLPEKAISAYEAQYIRLADQFNDFALFAQLHNFEGIQHALKTNEDALKLVASTAREIDVGLNNLNKIVKSIATNYSAIQAQDIVNDLKAKYVSLIEEPIIDDREIKSNTEETSLKFPKIVDAFIPQSYKCLLYQHKDIKLEDRSVWNGIPIQNDLDKFFIKYLYSLDSVDYPLIILGQPGSGKSLLTKVLSAQLMSQSYTVIRIPLREVNAEDGIDILVEDQIKKVTNRSLSTPGYGGFAAQFKEKPFIIILDGYDELLQAKGDVFSGYLEKVRRFQQDQKGLGRPVKIIITSRITLIDKARVPVNSTILRLMEFNAQQRQKWIEIWNNINSEYFTSNGISPFCLPQKEKGKENKIIELAEQPLLLLMLALYDSESNELVKMSNIKRTELYDNLLRRFVRRERRRYVPGFEDKNTEEQETIIGQEMNRLGVVAIGMYNRQEVVIRSGQLEKDLEVFKAHREDGSPKVHTLKESESVLGGFFFIHKSTAQDTDAHSDHSESAYEFLHNTFGEFLAADFILRNTINEVQNILIDRTYKSFNLSNHFSLEPNWFYCLMFVPLYSRPVVVEMLREHITKALGHVLKPNSSINMTEDNFIENLRHLVKNQLKMILNARQFPSVMHGEQLFDRNISLLGYLSTYSLNLVILACALSPDGFEFNESDYILDGENAVDSRRWDKLTALWKAWFLPADLMGLSVILRAKRVDNTAVLIKCNRQFEATRYELPIDILLCVSYTLGDSLTVGLSGLQTQRFCEITRLNAGGVCKILKSESPDIYFSYLISLLRGKLNDLICEKDSVSTKIELYEDVNRIINIITSDEQIGNININTQLNLFEILECCVALRVVFTSTRKNLITMLARLADAPYGSRKTPGPFSADKVIHLMQLAAKGTGYLLFRRRAQYSNRLHIYYDELSREVEPLPHTMSRYAHGDMMRVHQHDKKYSIYEPQLLDFSNGTLSALEPPEQEAYLVHLFEMHGVENLLDMNPDLSHVVLSLLNSIPVGRGIYQCAGKLLERCINQLRDVGICYMELSTLMNAISIARSIDANWFLNETRNLLQQQLFEMDFRLSPSILYLDPLVVAYLIEIMPDLFAEIPFEFFEAPAFERRFRQHIRYANLVDYISVFRCLFEYYHNRNRKAEVTHMLRWFKRFIPDIRPLSTADFSALSIGQIRDLAWYTNFIGDQQGAARINKFLQEHFGFLEGGYNHIT